MAAGTRPGFPAAAALRAEEDHSLDPRFDDCGSDDSSWGERSDSDDDDIYQNPRGKTTKHRGQRKAEAKEVEGGEGIQTEGAVAAELKEKKRQVYELSVLLEALEPVPGLNAAQFLDILTQPGREDVDYRDSKIVHLAKKCRNLNVALTQSKGRQAQVLKQLQDMKARLAVAEANGAGRKAAAVEEGEAEMAMKQKQQEAAMASLQKQVADLRVKYERSQEEVKKLQRVLIKEVGEEGEGAGGKVMEPGWRGRAQQIVMLKAKVRRLEALLEERKGTASTNATSSTDSASVGGSESASRVVDVDRKAEAEVQQIEKERIRMAEQALAEKQELQAELTSVRKKLEASKARTTYLEVDMGKLKEQMRCLLRKARTDDELIDAQRQELERVCKGRSRHAEMKAGEAPRTLHCPPGGHKSEERKRLEKEVMMSGRGGGLFVDDGVDLAMVCAAAGGQERPEDVIRRLRVRMKSQASSSSSSGDAAAGRRSSSGGGL